MIGVVTFIVSFEFPNGNLYSKADLLEAGKREFMHQYNLTPSSVDTFKINTGIKPEVSQPIKEEENGNI